MVYEIYELMNGEESTYVFAIIQTITMRVCVMHTYESVQKWMDENGLILENGWSLEKAMKIDYKEYNKMVSFN